MKKLYLLLTVLIFFCLAQAQNVGIGTATPDSSAKLEVSSTAKGFLPPRLTIAQRNAIANPAIGLVIFCSDCDELQVFNGTAWKNMSGSAACVSITFPFIKICNQVWMNKNLDVVTYRNGDSIPKVTDNAAWFALTTGAYCYYNNDSATYAATYGKLYNWYAVNDPRGLAPAGWHVATDAEWATIETCLGGSSVAGGAMKKTGTTHWASPNTGATNSSGFTGFPGGYRNYTGTFMQSSYYGFWWSSTEFDTSSAMDRYLGFDSALFYTSSGVKRFGLSVRCIRD